MKLKTCILLQCKKFLEQEYAVSGIGTCDTEPLQCVNRPK